MPQQTSLAASGNTYNPCLLMLKSKGYCLWAEESGERLLWNASKGCHSFMAYSPPELLGIVSLWEAFADNWNQQEPDLVVDLTKQAS